MTRRHANLAWHVGAHYDRPAPPHRMTAHALAAASARLGWDAGEAKRRYLDALTDGKKRLLRSWRGVGRRWSVCGSGAVWIVSQDAGGVWTAITVLRRGMRVCRVTGTRRGGTGAA